MLKNLRNLLHFFLRMVVERMLEIDLLRDRNKHTVAPPEEAEVVVSMTSYPARIKSAWISLETIFRQHYDLFAVVLVLTRSQFPTGKLPKKIRHLERRGLVVIWVEQDGKSADHIWPAYSRFRHARIVSVDDDKFFPRDLLAKLTAESDRYPGAVIGARGWEIAEVGGSLAFGVNWARAKRSTPSCLLFMPPGNGSLYPPRSLPELAGNYDIMRRVCPTADDVWFWAMALLEGTESRCLGMAAHRPVSRQRRTDSLASLNAGPAQFRAALDFFQLEDSVLNSIRESEMRSRLDEH